MTTQSEQSSAGERDQDLEWTPCVKRKSSGELTLARLESALRRVAGLLTKGKHEYLPIFIRLEEEVATCKENENAVRRAFQLCEDFSK